MLKKKDVFKMILSGSDLRENLFIYLYTISGLSLVLLVALVINNYAIPAWIFMG